MIARDIVREMYLADLIESLRTAPDTVTAVSRLVAALEVERKLEREACAQIADWGSENHGDVCHFEVADMIRARGAK